MPAAKKQFLVIGLGQFGTSVAKTLTDLGHEVLAIDQDPDRVSEVADFVTHAVQADATDEEALQAVGVRNFDAAIVTIGHSVQSSILVTLLCKDMGVPKVVAKAQGELHARVLARIGADEVIFPERDVGERLAQRLSATNVEDLLELSNDYALGKIKTPKGWVGRSLAELDLRQRYGINIVAIRRIDEMLTTLTAKDVLREGDELVVIGIHKDVHRLESL